MLFLWFSGCPLVWHLGYHLFKRLKGTKMDGRTRRAGRGGAGGRDHGGTPWGRGEVEARRNLYEPSPYDDITGWWFGTFFIFPSIGNNHPNWLIFFRGVQTTNQIYVVLYNCLFIYLIVGHVQVKHVIPKNSENRSGWWFGCHLDYVPINIGNFIIPIDCPIFQRGSNHQPVMHLSTQLSCRSVSSFLADQHPPFLPPNPIHLHHCPLFSLDFLLDDNF